MSACFCVSAVMLGNGGVRSSRKRLPKRARWPPKFGSLPKLSAKFVHLAALTQQVLVGLERSSVAEVLGPWETPEIPSSCQGLSLLMTELGEPCPAGRAWSWLQLSPGRGPRAWFVDT